MELSGLSQDGKNSPQLISWPAMPWATDWPWPSQVQLVTPGGMFSFRRTQ